MFMNNTNSFTKRHRLLGACLAALLLLCACSQGDAPLPNALQNPSLATAAPERGQMQTRASLPLPLEMASCDPYRETSYKAQAILGLVYESCLRLDEAGNVQPYLCDLWEFVGADTLRLHVREGVCFSDGTPLTAGHITQTLTGLRTSGKNSLYAYALGTITAWKLQEEGWFSVTFVGNPYDALCAMTFPIVAGEAGTGPYLVQSFAWGTGLELAANPHWWLKAPAITQISAVPLGQEESQLAALEAGTITFTYTRDPAASAYQHRAGLAAENVVSQNFEYLLFNTQTGPMANESMRRVAAQAVEREEILSVVYAGCAVLADTPVCPGRFGYSAAARTTEFDPEAAAQTLAQLGYTQKDEAGHCINALGEGVQLTLVTNESLQNATHLQGAYLVAAQLRDVGLQVQVLTYPLDELAQVLADGAFDIAYLGCETAPGVDYAAFFAADGALNPGAAVSPAMESALAALQQASSLETAAAAVAGVQVVCAQELPLLGICYRTNLLLHTSALTGSGGVHPSAVFSNIDEWEVR